jgi:hypothetical protein
MQALEEQPSVEVVVAVLAAQELDEVNHRERQDQKREVVASLDHNQLVVARLASLADLPLAAAGLLSLMLPLMLGY